MGMFYVYPDAELPNPFALTPKGERAYRWVELPLRCCYFLVTIESGVDDSCAMARQVLLGNVHDVIDAANTVPLGGTVSRVELMSPGDRCGEEGYRMDRLVEIWRDKSKAYGYTFKMADGRSIEDCLGEDGDAAPDLELVATF